MSVLLVVEVEEGGVVRGELITLEVEAEDSVDEELVDSMEARGRTWNRNLLSVASCSRCSTGDGLSSK